MPKAKSFKRPITAKAPKAAKQHGSSSNAKAIYVKRGAVAGSSKAGGGSSGGQQKGARAAPPGGAAAAGGHAGAHPAARGAAGPASTSGRGSSGQTPTTGTASWHARSIIDRQAADAVARLLHAAETRSGGASIKSLTLAPHVVHKKPTFAVTCQTLKYLPLLRDVVAAAQLLEQHAELTPATAYVLAYEVLLGQGCREQGPAERAVLRGRGAMQQRLAALRAEAGTQELEGLLAHLAAGSQSGGAAAAAGGGAGPVAPHPRWARVNTLKISVADALARLRADRATAAAEVDDLLPDVLRLPPGTDLHDHPMVEAGELILQSKASCMPAHALSPAPGWTVLDACAAPGNKTTHAAALVGPSGRVLAFDKDQRRLKRLVANAKGAGAGGIVAAECADFLLLDPLEARFAEVRGIILDPSCSGSGTVVTRMDHLLPRAQGGGGGGEDAAEAQRVEQLAKFQACGAEAAGGLLGMLCLRQRKQQLTGVEPSTEAALRHALRFPALRRLAYSTCSAHRRENEDVVAAVLPAAEEAGFALVDAFPRGKWPRRGLPGSVAGGGEAHVVRTDAYEDGTDGFFVAVFERAEGGGGGGTSGSGGGKAGGREHGGGKKRAARGSAHGDGGLKKARQRSKGAAA